MACIQVIKIVVLLQGAFFCAIMGLCQKNGLAVEPAGFCPRSYAYVLQAEDLAESREGVVKKLAESGRDAIILDAFFTTGERWTAQEIESIRSGKKGRKVICYFSIGEAENYRPYWEGEWQINKPDFLLSENPDWPGNFKVRYWDKDWQHIMFVELVKIMKAGFDGVMLDIVDGFEFFEADGEKYTDHKVNPLTGNTYRRDMADFVCQIAKTARKKAPAFLVIPQNGAQLMAIQKYRKTVSAQALESLFTDDNKIQPADHTSYVFSFLRPFMNDGGAIMLTEYCSKDKAVTVSRKQAKKYHVVLLQTNRALDKLGYSPKADVACRDKK